MGREKPKHDGDWSLGDEVAEAIHWNSIQYLAKTVSQHEH